MPETKSFGCARQDCPNHVKGKASCSRDTVLLNEYGQCTWAEHLDIQKSMSQRKVPIGKGN